MPIFVDADRDQGVHVHHAPVFPNFEYQCIGGDEGVRALIEWPGAERFDLFVFGRGP